MFQYIFVSSHSVQQNPKGDDKGTAVSLVWHTQTGHDVQSNVHQIIHLSQYVPEQLDVEVAFTCPIHFSNSLRGYIFFKNLLLAEAATRGAVCKKGILRNFAKFTGKHLCQSPLFNKVAGLRDAPLFKKRPWHKCFPVNLVKFLRTPFFTEHLGSTVSVLGSPRTNFRPLPRGNPHSPDDNKCVFYMLKWFNQSI